MKICPYCEAEIANNAKKCRYCGECIIKREDTKICPYCESIIPLTAKKCRYCRERMDSQNNEKVEKGEMGGEKQKKLKWYEGEMTYKKSFYLFMLNVLKDVILVACILGLTPYDAGERAPAVIFFCIFNEIIRLIINLVKSYNKKGYKNEKSKLWLFIKLIFKFLNNIFRDVMIFGMIYLLVLPEMTNEYFNKHSELLIFVLLACLYELIMFFVRMVKIIKNN